MTLPRIETELTAKNGQFDRAMDNSDRKVGALERRMESASARIGRFGNAATALGKKMSIVSAGVVVAGGAFFALARGTAQAGNSIDKQSKAAGVSAEAFQELGFAVGQVSEITDQQLGKALQRLTRSMGDAANGLKAPLDAFEAIGISQEDLISGTISTEEAFTRLIEELQKMKSPAEAAAVAAALLGREGGALGPILRQSGGDIEGLRQKAQDLGIVLSNDAVRASAEFTDQMDIFNRQMRVVRDQIGAALLPVLTQSLIPAIQTKVIPAMQSMAEKIGQVIEWFGGLPGPVQEVAGVIAAALGIGGPAILAVGALSAAVAAIVAVTGPIALFIAAASLLAAAWVAWGDEITAAVQTAITFVSDKITEIVVFIETLPARMLEIGRNIVDGLQQGIAERWAAFKEYMYSLLPEIPQWARDVLQIESPSKVFAEIGGFIGEGLAQGIAESQAMVNRAIGTLADGAVARTDSMVSGILGSMSQLFAGSKVLAVAQAAINTWQGATEALKLPFPANIGAFLQTAATGLGAVSAIQSTSPGSPGVAAGGAAGGTASAAPAVTGPLDVRISGVSRNDNLSVGSVSDLFNMLLTEAGDRGIRPFFAG